jgi:hypothetical protein
VLTADLPYPRIWSWTRPPTSVTLYAPKFYFDQRDITPPALPRMRLYFNTRLYELFTSLPNTFVSYSGDKNYLMRVESNNLNTVVVISSSLRYISDSKGISLFTVILHDEGLLLVLCIMKVCQSASDQPNSGSLKF